MNKASKIILVLIFTLILFFLLYFAMYFFKPLNNQNSNAPIDIADVVPEEEDLNDPLVALKQGNELYREGLDLSKAGKSQEAIAKLTESKSLATTESERSNIDFSISLIQAELDRSAGVDKFYDLSQNDSYPERTRALAMLRTYLNYSKYQDESVLRKIAENYKIAWTNKDEVIYKFMQMTYELHPFAFAKIKMIDYELNSITEKAVAAELYNTSRPDILKGIDEHMRYSGEFTELTSSMLAHSRVLARLYLDFDKMIPVNIVKAAYQENIDYSNTHDHTINKQYALIDYANFLSGIGEFDNATSMLQLILNEGLHRALKEALPTMVIESQYPHLPALANVSTVPAVTALINSIGTKN